MAVFLHRKWRQLCVGDIVVGIGENGEDVVVTRVIVRHGERIRLFYDGCPVDGHELWTDGGGLVLLR